MKISRVLLLIRHRNSEIYDALPDRTPDHGLPALAARGCSPRAISLIASSFPAAMSSPSSVPVLTQHTVRLGDSLSEIAKFYYGKSSNALVELIFRANTDLLDDPDEIFQGDVIRIPVPPT